jgi:hypothetical protein
VQDPAHFPGVAIFEAFCHGISSRLEGAHYASVVTIGNGKPRSERPSENCYPGVSAMKINGTSVFGFLLLAAGSFGVYNAVMSFGQPEVEKRDVTTTGVITRIHGTEVRHTLTNVKLNSQFNFDYKFTAEDGNEYSSSTIVDESEASSLHEGQDITVCYHSHQPSINASVPYGTYVSVDQMPNAPPLARLCGCAAIGFVGGLILFLAFRDQKQAKLAAPEIAPQLQTVYGKPINN